MSAALPPVLVVDDERNMRRSLETVLVDEGYKMKAVESAEAGLELLAHERFLMVITDAHLGGMTGYEFLRQVRHSWPQVPVLMITAYATPKLAVEAIQAGAIDYLSKPFAPEELLHAISRCGPRRFAVPQLSSRCNGAISGSRYIATSTTHHSRGQITSTPAGAASTGATYF